MPPKPNVSGAFVRGVDASAGLLLQPKGSIPRGSNLILTKRGSLQVCDGTAIVAAWDGVPTPGRGKAMCVFLFQPIGVSPYYLLITKALDLPLGHVTHLAVADSGSADGTFTAGTYFWYVTATDGTGAETDKGLEVTAAISANHSADLTWNIVPNAVGYNVYRGTVSNGETLLLTPKSVIGTLAQPTFGTLTVSFKDTGFPTDGVTPPPVEDTTQQTAMYAMNVASGPIGYGTGNQVAVWPADARFMDDLPGGGTGGQGGTGGGNPGTPGVTPVGAYPPGNVSFIPDIVQFVNQAMIALGNAYPPQIFRDGGGSPDNPAVVGRITSTSTDAFGVVTLTCNIPHGLVAGNEGACIRLQNMVDPVFDGVFQIIAIPSTTTLKIRNLAAIGHGTTTGIFIITTIPLFNTFTPQFPIWVASTGYSVNSAIVPTTPNTFYYVVVAPAAGGESGAVEPTWPTTVGQKIQNGTVTFQCAGLIADAAPAPPGAGHIRVYAGALWVFNTAATNTADGLDGPTCLRMSDINNPLSWNPVNAAFLDKDDGMQGTGLAVFTITAQGIPPQGSLIAFKLHATYQISSVFGASNFAIQRVTTDMGCLAPRSIQFIPGFGIGRLSHLGIAVFDGVNDRILSPQVNPYLFPNNDPELADIVVADANWTPLSMGVLTAEPAMYCLFIPIGNSGGALTRALCFDLILRAWTVVDLPFPISATLQAYGTTSNPVTILGSFSDGTLQRWQAGDIQWATPNGLGLTLTPAPIQWMLRSAAAASKSPDERLYSRRCWVVGQCGEIQPLPTFINPRINTVAIGAQSSYMPPAGQRFTAQAAVMETSDLFDAIVTGTGPVTIDAVGFHLEPKPLGLLVGEIV